MLFPNALYSASVVVPDSKTSIIIGINANIVPKDEVFALDDYFQLEINSESTRNRKEAEMTLSKMTTSEIQDLLKKLFVSRLNFSVLDLFDAKLHWAIQCHVFVIGELQISDLDYIFRAVREAVGHTKFPKVAVNFNTWSEEYNYEITGEDMTLFDQASLPLALVAGEIDGRVVLDLSAHEVLAVDSYYVVAIDAEKTITDIEKIDGNPVSVNKLGNFISLLMSMAQNLVKNH
jgi:exosome complex RNA-binding protein Rrp42 (RNase PH superfamily)